MLYYQFVEAKATSNKTKTFKSEGPKYVSSEIDRPFIHQAASPESDRYSRIESHQPHDSAPLLKSRSSSPNVKSLKKNSDHFITSYSLDTKKGKGDSWAEEYSRIENEIRVRHYSPKTLKTYRGWVRKFQTFTRSKSPETLSVEDVKDCLTFLAVKRKVSSTTQNQAFNSLLFFFGIYRTENSARSMVLFGPSESPISGWFYLAKKLNPY